LPGFALRRSSFPSSTSGFLLCADFKQLCFEIAFDGRELLFRHLAFCVAVLLDLDDFVDRQYQLVVRFDERFNVDKAAFAFLGGFDARLLDSSAFCLSSVFVISVTFFWASSAGRILYAEREHHLAFPERYRID
jgi:hypothetical protein